MGRMWTVVLPVGLLSLVIGFAVGWQVGGRGDSEADVACAAADGLPGEIEEGEADIPLLHRVSGTGLLAMSAGDGDDDLQELSRAGSELMQIGQRLELETYGDTLEDLLQACRDR